MPNVTKHTSNNLVTVSYPVREAVLEITKAEHALILMFSHEKFKMVKFIRAQYNLGLYEAKQLVYTVIASAGVEPEVKLQSSVEETEVDWNCIPKGAMIYVKDNLYEDWYKREFIRYNPDSVYSFICKAHTALDPDAECVWQRAKLITD